MRTISTTRRKATKTTPAPPRDLPGFGVKELAVTALTDERTVRRYLAGEPVRYLSVRRIQRALETLRARAPETWGV